MKEKRIAAFDFIRVMSAFGIVAFHFSNYTNCPSKPFFLYKNGVWGNVCSTVFFMLSGTLLCLRYQRVATGRELKEFYYKRWKSIFPMYYAAYAWYFLKIVRGSGAIFFRGAPWLLIQTFAGLDGYLYYRFPDNYYILGEWFTGAIILLYLLFPLILWAFRRSERFTAVSMTALYAGMLLLYRFGNVFVLDDFRNLISCMFSFWMGMEIARHRKLLDDVRVVAVCWAGAVLFAAVTLPLNANVSVHLMALCCFVVLYDLGKRIFALSGTLRSLFGWLGGLSFGIFLMQHVTILEFVNAKNPSSVRGMFLLMALVMVYIVLRAWILRVVTDAVLQSSLFRKAENRILRRSNA